MSSITEAAARMPVAAKVRTLKQKYRSVVAPTRGFDCNRNQVLSKTIAIRPACICSLRKCPLRLADTNQGSTSDDMHFSEG